MKPVRMEISREEAQALMGLMEGGLKAIGAPAARAFVVLADRIAAAVAGSEAPDEPTAENVSPISGVKAHG